MKSKITYEQNYVQELRKRNIHITSELISHTDGMDTHQFIIEAPLFKESPFTHPIQYGTDYDLQKAYHEVAEEWAYRLGYRYKVVFE